MVFNLIQDPMTLPFIITTQGAITTLQKEVMNEPNSQDSTKNNFMLWENVLNLNTSLKVIKL
jgi:hypothetical protein